MASFAASGESGAADNWKADCVAPVRDTRVQTAVRRLSNYFFRLSLHLSVPRLIPQNVLPPSHNFSFFYCLFFLSTINDNRM